MNMANRSQTHSPGRTAGTDAAMTSRLRRFFGTEDSDRDPPSVLECLGGLTHKSNI
jgi:hypothetical protein